MIQQNTPKEKLGGVLSVYNLMVLVSGSVGVMLFDQSITFLQIKHDFDPFGHLLGIFGTVSYLGAAYFWKKAKDKI